MTSITTKPDSLQHEAETAPHLFDDWFDPIETEVRGRARQFIEELIRGELDEALDEARRLAMKKELVSWGIATEAGNDR